MLKVLARGITALTVLAALAAAGAAMGGGQPPQTYSADFEYGGSISFVLEQGENARKIRDIEITDIHADCEGQTGLFEFDISGKTTVQPDRSFAVRSEDDDGSLEALVQGTFSRKYGRAKGTARVWGKYRFDDGIRRKCNTGKQKFVARMTG